MDRSRSEVYKDIEEAKGDWRKEKHYEEYTVEESLVGFKITRIREGYMEIHMEEEPRVKVEESSTGKRAFVVKIKGMPGTGKKTSAGDIGEKGDRPIKREKEDGLGKGEKGIKAQEKVEAVREEKAGGREAEAVKTGNQLRGRTHFPARKRGKGVRRGTGRRLRRTRGSGSELTGGSEEGKNAKGIEKQEKGGGPEEDGEPGTQRVSEQRIREQKVGEQRVREQKVGEQRVREQKVGEQRVREQKIGEQRVREQKVGEQRVREQKVGEQRVREQKVGEHRDGELEVWKSGVVEGHGETGHKGTKAEETGSEDKVPAATNHQKRGLCPKCNGRRRRGPSVFILPTISKGGSPRLLVRSVPSYAQKKTQDGTWAYRLETRPSGNQEGYRKFPASKQASKEKETISKGSQGDGTLCRTLWNYIKCMFGNNKAIKGSKGIQGRNCKCN